MHRHLCRHGNTCNQELQEALAVVELSAVEEHVDLGVLAAWSKLSDGRAAHLD